MLKLKFKFVEDMLKTILLFEKLGTKQMIKGLVHLPCTLVYLPFICHKDVLHKHYE